MVTLQSTIRDALIPALRARATHDRAVHERAYLKSDLTHLGVTVGDVRTCVKHLQRAHTALSASKLMALVRTLWSHQIDRRPVHELRFAAVLWLSHHSRQLTPQLVLKPARKGQPPWLEKMLGECNTWALLDPLAINVVGPLVVGYPAMNHTLDQWSQHRDMWLRRAAVLALLKPLRRGEGDFARFAKYAETMLHEKEFFIRKALGWVLRERSKKCPDEVFAWLLPRAAVVSGLTFREASKKLSVVQQHALARARAAKQ